MHSYGRVETEMGQFWVACSSDGIAMISPAKQAPAVFEAIYRQYAGARPERRDISESYIHAVREAAAGRPFEAVPIDLSNLSKFQRKVLKALQKIPAGEVRTYAWLARKAGQPNAARAVGNTMARNPVPILIPCHRVVPAAGGIGNYGMGSAMKRDLLMREGVPVDEL